MFPNHIINLKHKTLKIVHVTNNQTSKEIILSNDEDAGEDPHSLLWGVINL